jgi:hypothetical protein
MTEPDTAELVSILKPATGGDVVTGGSPNAPAVTATVKTSGRDWVWRDGRCFRKAGTSRPAQRVVVSPGRRWRRGVWPEQSSCAAWCRACGRS